MDKVKYSPGLIIHPKILIHKNYGVWLSLLRWRITEPIFDIPKLPNKRTPNTYKIKFSLKWSVNKKTLNYFGPIVPRKRCDLNA